MKLRQLSQNIFEVNDFLSVQDCARLIELSESIGFHDADVALSDSKRQQLNHIRNNSRVNDYSQPRADSWWQQFSKLGLPDFENAEPSGCSPHFRFYRYEPGQKFNMHKDGRQMVNGNQTLFTMLVYLNAGYTGGETVFRQDQLVVTPKVGKALIFEHHLWHKGTKLESGTKYVLRTDIEYKTKIS